MGSWIRYSYEIYIYKILINILMRVMMSVELNFAT